MIAQLGLGTASGSLTVNLQIPASRGPPFPAPYDIIMLGPKTSGDLGLYGEFSRALSTSSLFLSLSLTPSFPCLPSSPSTEYSVVSDPLELTLFVLARNYSTFFEKYNATVIDFLQENGYVTFLNTPLPTEWKGCAEYSVTDLWSCAVHDVQ